MTNILKMEFIGKQVEIIRSRNTQLQGLTGKIVDETRSSFKVLVTKQKFREFKMIMKKDNVFLIERRLVEGNKIMKQPEDRIKIKG